jgi:DNA replication protein DnaC
METKDATAKSLETGKIHAVYSKKQLLNLSENLDEARGEQVLVTHFDRLPSIESDQWIGLDLGWHPALKQAVERLILWYGTQRGGIVLAGEFGCGKTHLAQVVSTFWGYTGRMIRESDLIANIRGSYQAIGHNEQEVLTPYARAKLLVLDDLGSAYVKSESTDWYQDILWRILDTRAQENLATMMTTNFDFNELSNRLGGRAFDRLGQLLGSRENFVDMSGIPSYRWKSW